MNTLARFGACLPRMLENHGPPVVSRVRQGLVILILALGPVSVSAQIGRDFVSTEAYVGLSRIVYVGKIVELVQIEYKKPLVGIQKYGKTYRLVFEVSEIIRGDKTGRLELVLALQSSRSLEYMRDKSVEIMLVAGPNDIGGMGLPEIGIEEQGKQAGGESYRFRLLEPVKVPESDGSDSIASQLNNDYDFCRMFTNELEIVEGREAILKRARAFAKENPIMTSAVWLDVPNEFGALCADPAAYCRITLPVCKSTEKTLVTLKHDPERIFRRIILRNKRLEIARMLNSIDNALVLIHKVSQSEAEHTAPSNGNKPSN